MDKMSIFLLEDKTTDAGLAIHALRKWWPGCEIEHVVTIDAAKKVLAEKKDFDVALLDMQLPDGNGMDVLFEIRHSGADMAVVMLTGSGDEEVAVAALKAGADDYMVKQPGYNAKIPQVVEFAIENHRQFQQRESSIIQVLYIEHNAADVDFTKRYITRYAPYIRLKNVHTGEEALKIIPEKQDFPERWKYHVVLMDYRLPGITALEIIKEIRLERKLDIPIIIVTGHGNEEVAVQALKVGASEYLVKRENYLTRLPSLISGAYEHCELKRKQKALEENEAKYRLLAENSGDMIFTLDFDLNYTYVSPAIKALRGYTPEEVMQKKISDALTPSSLKIVKSTFDIVLPKIKSGDISLKPMVVELEMYKKDGSTAWFEVKASVSTDSQGKPNGILGVSRDVSKRKAFQDELRKLSRAVTQSLDSIVITDKDGKIEYINPKFTQLTGYKLDEVFGENPRILNSGEQPKSYYKELWDTILARKDWYGEFRNKKKNGELYWESASISSLVNDEGEVTHFVAVKEDITEKKKIMDDLIEAKEKAEESDRLKSAFLANMSHEIRTPMNGILGFTDLLLNPDLTSEEIDSFIKIIHQSGQRLLNTVTDIVEISKIEAGIVQIVQKETDVNERIEELVRFFKPEAEKKGLQLILNELLPESAKKLITDQNKLDSILTNLIKNAIKYTNSGTINMGCRTNDNEIEFYVKDTGIGIPSDRQNAIFVRFMQADITDTRVFEGSGLGLAIAKSHVEMLGGKIWVQSEEGLGSTFYFTLPFNINENEKAFLLKESKSENDNNKVLPAKIGLKLLIAENDEPSRNYISIIVKDFSIEILEATTGVEAIEICRNTKDIDLILMDIQMPDMNGYDATREIRKFNTNVVVIAQTAFALSGDREKAIEAGCNDYISKPIKKIELEKIIKRLFRNNSPISKSVC
jgi:PAS domain S-box-containing protein